MKMYKEEDYQSDITAFKQVLKSLKGASASMNEVKELVFTDKGKYWDARVVVRYYQHLYKDDKDMNCLDRYEEQWHVKYLGTAPESVHKIKYWYTSPNGGGGGTGIHMTKLLDGYYFNMSGSGSSSFPDKDEVYNLTIEWDSQKELLQLKSR